ncbi:secreted antigen 1 [Babesia divergens]|uniref:Secreted antigen 1 n=1 Tax=Babesia divergens TaxID=32595 RepID=A0AAD9G6P7_BABDI|nr:secreted antigen 1 [Babesia divergens]
MKLVGILRVTTLCFVATGFYGPSAVSCSNLEVSPSTESPIVDISEISGNPKESTENSKEYVISSQSGLVFHSSAWDDSHLATSFLFVREFCKDVSGKKFTEKLSNTRSEELYWACEDATVYVRALMKDLLPRYGPGAVAERKEIPRNIYEDVLKTEEFEVYVKWLVKNVPNITKSYKNMIGGSAKLSEEKLKTETKVGPLKYGFVFIGEGWKQTISWVVSTKDALPRFLGALKNFQKCLENVLKNPHYERKPASRNWLKLFSREKKSDIEQQHDESSANEAAVKEHSSSDGALESPMKSKIDEDKEQKETEEIL